MYLHEMNTSLGLRLKVEVVSKDVDEKLSEEKGKRIIWKIRHKLKIFSTGTGPYFSSVLSMFVFCVVPTIMVICLLSTPHKHKLPINTPPRRSNTTEFVTFQNSHTTKHNF